jgi:hypothetical protein
MVARMVFGLSEGCEMATEINGDLVDNDENDDENDDAYDDKCDIEYDVADDDEPSDLIDELAIKAVLDSDTGRVRCVHTDGMWWLGLPELYVLIPLDFTPAAGFDWRRLAFVLASGLMTLGHELIEMDHFELAPYSDVFGGNPVELWLGPHEAPDGIIAEALPAEVDTVTRVECSLWTRQP